MADSKVKVAVVSGAVSVIVALITAAPAIYLTRSTARNAAAQAEASAEKATSFASDAEASLKQAKQAILAIPGSVATHYRGKKENQSNQTTERFNFSERVYDPQGAVVVGADWRLIAPIDGVYYIGASFALRYGKDGSSHTTPYVSCRIQRLKIGTTTPESLSGAIAFNPSCSFAGVYYMSEGDQVFVELGKAGAYDGYVSGDFFSVLVGPRQGS